MKSIICVLFACVALAAANYGNPEPSYGGHQESHGYSHAGPAQVHAYHVPAPHVKCGHSLLVGCQPQTSHVACTPHKGGYGHQSHGYGHQQSHGYGHQSHGY